MWSLCILPNYFSRKPQRQNHIFAELESRSPCRNLNDKYLSKMMLADELFFISWLRRTLCSFTLQYFAHDSFSFCTAVHIPVP